MWTTVSLDPDVVSAIDRLRRETGLGPSEALNELVRRGLTPTAPRHPYRHRTSELGLTVDVTDVAGVLDVLDE